MIKKVDSFDGEIDYKEATGKSKKSVISIFKGNCGIEVQGTYKGKKVHHFFKYNEKHACPRCGKDLSKEKACYMEVSTVGLSLGMMRLAQIFMCCDCALKQGKTNYGALIVKSGEKQKKKTKKK